VDLSTALSRLSLQPFAGFVHRVYDPGHGFLEAIGSYLHGARWNRRRQYGALYTSLDRETAIAEVRRAAEKGNLHLGDLARRDHVVIRARLTRAFDLNSSAFYQSLGRSAESLLRDARLCLRIADEARTLGCEALLAPSAVGTGTNLVIYMDRLAPGWTLEEVDREEDIFHQP